MFLELEMGLGWRMSWSISESGRRSSCSGGMTCIPRGMGYGFDGDSIAVSAELVLLRFGSMKVVERTGAPSPVDAARWECGYVAMKRL